mmetsp:Transcript_26424/g.105746  ORF Transcript_26424/g.105746 Transcript_26424/m.105746 type:complete len:239 (-) Transcript_26424:57-773(-)
MRDAKARRKIVLNSDWRPPMPSLPKSKSELNSSTLATDPSPAEADAFLSVIDPGGADLATRNSTCDGWMSCPNRPAAGSPALPPFPELLLRSTVKSSFSTVISRADRRNAMASFCVAANTWQKYSFLKYSPSAAASTSIGDFCIDWTARCSEAKAILGVGAKACASTRCPSSSCAVRLCSVETPSVPGLALESPVAVNTQFPDAVRRWTSTLVAPLSVAPRPWSGLRALNGAKSDGCM